jgi:hypothetical protein
MEKNTDYIILNEQGEPLTFSDGKIVLYGELNEAQEDALENETIIRLVDYAKQKNIDWKKLI